MITPELSNYVKDSRAAGMDDVAIKQALLSQGWQEADAQEALAQPAIAAALPITVPEVALQPNKFKKLLFPAIGVAVLLAIGASAAYFYYPMSPEKVLTKMMEKSGNITSGNYKASFEATINSAALTSYIPEVLNSSKPDASDSGKVAGATTYQSKIDFSGTFDSADLNHPKSEVSINGTAAGYSASADLKMLDEIIFLKLTKAPEIGIVDLKKILNTWIKFDISEASKTAGMDVETNIKELNEQQKKQIQDIFAQAHIFSVSNKLANGKIDGVPTYHYAYTINKKALFDLGTKVMEVATDKPMTDSEKQDLDNFYKDINIKDGEIWIGTNDYYLYKITGGISATNFVSSTSSAEISWELEFSNINKPVNIQAPTDFKTMEEVISLFMPASTGPVDCSIEGINCLPSKY